jgi:tether containing UBX domain for GLUT4
MNNIIVCLDDLPQNRLTVKATPTMQLQTILEMACTKFQLDPKEWGLRYKKTPMDLSLPIRFSSLPASGTRLDLFRLSASQKAGAAQAAMVNVAVQLDEGGGRVTEKFPSDFTIWQVLLAIESRSQGYIHSLCLILFAF